MLLILSIANFALASRMRFLHSDLRCGCLQLKSCLFLCLYCEASNAVTCAEWCGIPDKIVPIHCGVLWYLHIGKTGGTSVQLHLNKLSLSRNWTHVNLYVPHGRWDQSTEWKRILAELHSPKPKLTVTQHHGTPGIGAYFLEEVLRPAACRLKGQGCQVVRVFFKLELGVFETINHILHYTISA